MNFSGLDRPRPWDQRSCDHDVLGPSELTNLGMSLVEQNDRDETEIRAGKRYRVSLRLKPPNSSANYFKLCCAAYVDLSVFGSRGEVGRRESPRK